MTECFADISAEAWFASVVVEGRNSAHSNIRPWQCWLYQLVPEYVFTAGTAYRQSQQSSYVWFWGNPAERWRWLLPSPLSSWGWRLYRLHHLHGWRSQLAWQWNPTLTGLCWLSHQHTLVVHAVGCFLDWEAGSLTPFFPLATLNSAFPGVLAGVSHRDPCMGLSTFPTPWCAWVPEPALFTHPACWPFSSTGRRGGCPWVGRQLSAAWGRRGSRAPRWEPWAIWPTGCDSAWWPSGQQGAGTVWAPVTGLNSDTGTHDWSKQWHRKKMIGHNSYIGTSDWSEQLYRYKWLVWTVI